MAQLDLHAGARSDEKFFISRYQPIPISVQFVLGRVTLWLPYPFISVVFGLLGHIGVKIGMLDLFWKLWASSYFRSLQIYFGIKCDGTRTYMLRHGQLGGTSADRKKYVMVLTPKELAAFRIRQVSKEIRWDNQGGC